MQETPVATAAVVLDLVRAGRFEEIRDLFAEPLRPMVSATALRAVWKGEVARLGPFVSSGHPVTEPTLVVTATGAGQLAGLQLAPAGEAEHVDRQVVGDIAGWLTLTPAPAGVHPPPPA